jgi:hypothetical protein
MPVAMRADYHASIGRSVADFTMVRPRKGWLVFAAHRSKWSLFGGITTVSEEGHIAISRL